MWEDELPSHGWMDEPDWRGSEHPEHDPEPKASTVTITVGLANGKAHVLQPGETILWTEHGIEIARAP